MPDQTTEAPASVNFKVSYKGIDIQITNRDVEVKIQPYFEKAKTAIDWALGNGFTAPVQKSAYPPKTKDYVEGRVCPKDGGKLVNKVSKAGKKYIACENGKYDVNTKTTIGCNYVDWLDNTKVIDSGGTYESFAAQEGVGDR